MKIDSVAVTGARGYLGGWVVHYLQRMGKTVYQLPGRTDDGWLSCASVADAVVHLAWYSTAGDAHGNLHRQCLERTKSLMKIAGSRELPMVFSSTASVYGVVEDREMTESDVVRPNCSYTVSKSKAEDVVLDETEETGVILRLGSLMGVGRTRTKTDVVVNAFAQTAWADNVILCWSPNSYKPVVHVRDAAKMVLAGLFGQIRGDAAGVYNLVYGCPRARDVAEVIHLQTGAGIQYGTEPPGPRRSCRVSNWKILRDFPGVRHYRSIETAVAEFRGRKPQPGDKNIPWNPQ